MIQIKCTRDLVRYYDASKLSGLPELEDFEDLDVIKNI